MDIRQIVIDETERRGWSGYRLAKEAGLPLRAVQNYCSGSSDIIGARLGIILDALDLEIRPRRRGSQHKR